MVYYKQKCCIKGVVCVVYTITLNPSIDYLMYPKSFSTGKINRSEKELSNFGGKGLNVSFVLSALGVKNRALGFAGGFSGREIIRLATRAGIECDFCETAEDSRINVKIISDMETAVNGKGPLIRKDEEDALLKKLSELSEEDTVILSGKGVESESGELLRNIIEAVSHTRFVADMEGDDLLYAIEKHPFLIKPNIDELLAIFGGDDASDETVAKHARELQRRGAANVLVSLGSSGAILASDDGKIYRMRAPKIEVKSTVGAGDSCLAGFVAGYGRGPQFALSLAMAAGAATAASDEIADAEEILSILHEM